MKFQGQLFHHFHGEYSASVIFLVSSESEGKQLIANLPIPFDYKEKNGKKAVVKLCTSEDVSKLEEWSDNYRCEDLCRMFDCEYRPKRHSIGSCAHSIDVGPVFELDLPYVDLVTPNLPFKESDE